MDMREPRALKRAQSTTAQPQPPWYSGRKGPDNLKGIKRIRTHLRYLIMKKMPCFDQPINPTGRRVPGLHRRNGPHPRRNNRYASTCCCLRTNAYVWQTSNSRRRLNQTSTRERLVQTSAILNFQTGLISQSRCMYTLHVYVACIPGTSRGPADHSCVYLNC